MLPPLTTYEQNGEKIGQTMAQALIENIELGSEYKSTKIMVTGRLLKGGSVAQV